MDAQPRLILLHKHKTSGRVRFLCLPYGVVAFKALPALLGVFAGIDPPFAAAERAGGRFIAITESRALSDVERQLLRRTYEHVLG